MEELRLDDPPAKASLPHLGFRGKISRSTLADANKSNDRRIYEVFANIVIAVARPLYADDPIGGGQDAHAARRRAGFTTSTSGMRFRRRQERST